MSYLPLRCSSVLLIPPFSPIPPPSKHLPRFFSPTSISAIALLSSISILLSLYFSRLLCLLGKTLSIRFLERGMCPHSFFLVPSALPPSPGEGEPSGSQLRPPRKTRRRLGVKNRLPTQRKEERRTGQRDSGGLLEERKESNIL